jgi:hypothetical protein
MLLSELKKSSNLLLANTVMSAILASSKLILWSPREDLQKVDMCYFHQYV